MATSRVSFRTKQTDAKSLFGSTEKTRQTALKGVLLLVHLVVELAVPRVAGRVIGSTAKDITHENEGDTVFLQVFG